MTPACVRPRDEAEALYLANRRLAMWALRRTFRRRPDLERRLLSRMQIEDAEQLAAMALWRCCLCWDHLRGTLGSLVPCAVEHALAAECERRTLPTVSLSALGGENSRPFEPPAPRSPSPWERADDGAEVAYLLSLLPRRWRLVLALRYGLDGHEPQTLQEVSRRLGVTKQAVQAMQARALERLARRAPQSGPRGAPAGAAP